MVVVALRASRLKINKRKYFPIKIQLPIHYTTNDDEDFSFLGIALKIRGENEKEFQFLKYMGKEFKIYSLNPTENNQNQGKRTRILKKFFLKNDVVTYLIEVYSEDDIKKSIENLQHEVKNGFVSKEEFFHLKYEVDNIKSILTWVNRIIVGAVIVALLALIITQKS